MIQTLIYLLATIISMLILIILLLEHMNPVLSGLVTGVVLSPMWIWLFIDHLES